MSDAIERQYWAGVRAMLPRERLRRSLSLFQGYYNQAASRFRRENPVVSECAVRRAMASRLYGGDVQTLRLLHEQQPMDESVACKITPEVTHLELAELARRVGDTLERHAIRYHLTGGVVAAYYGQMRTTQDVDVVMRATDCRDSQALYNDLRREFLVEKSALEHALRTGTMFQLLDVEFVLRADIYTAPILPGRFARVVFAELTEGIKLPIASPEDAILSKLHWIRLGSERSRQDVVAMLRVQHDLDDEYLETVAEELGATSLLAELRSKAANYDPQAIL